MMIKIMKKYKDDDDDDDLLTIKNINNYDLLSRPFNIKIKKKEKVKGREKKRKDPPSNEHSYENEPTVQVLRDLATGLQK